LATNPEIYRAAAKRVEHGWTRFTLVDSNGSVCLVGSITGEFQMLSREQRDQLYAQLVKYPTFRWLTRRDHVTDSGAIMTWNDLPWRRKSQVVKVLNATADSVEVPWLREKIANLERERVVMQARIADLERVNSHLWRRLLSTRDLTADRESLARLDQEIEGTLREVELAR
jgi:hypothetical protein